jgi:hypothetical protein
MEVGSTLSRRSAPALVATLVVILYGFFADLMLVNYLWGILSAAALIFLASNCRPSWAAAVGAVGTLEVLFLSGVAQMATFLLSICLPGILIGSLAGRGWGGFRAVFWGLVPVLVLMGLFMTAYSDISTSLSLTIEAWVDSFALKASEMGQSPELLERMTGDLKQFGRVLVELLPSFMLLSALFNLTLAYFISHRVGAKLSSGAAGLPPFSRWRVSDHLLGVVILGALFSLLNDPTLRIVGHNLLAFCAGLYVFVGLALAEFFMLKFRTPGILKILVYLLIFLGQMISLTLLGVLGLFDSRLDFRKLKSGVILSA